MRSDRPRFRAKYRLLQSWYREHVLDSDYGFDRRRGVRPVGSLLAEHEVDRDRALNFLGDPLVLDYVDERVPQVLATGGSLHEARLRHNMLSSMPMAFTLVGSLRSAPDRAAIVSNMFGLDCAEVVDIHAEWVPDRPLAELLNDRTAFDAVVLYRDSRGTLGLLGIETKYTEPLSQKKYDRPRYREVATKSGWFKRGAAGRLVSARTNQLWRNAMLAAAARGTIVSGARVEIAHLGVVGLAEDASLWNAVTALTAEMTEPQVVRPVSWELLIEQLGDTSLASVAALFDERYLDTSPLKGSGAQ